MNDTFLILPIAEASKVVYDDLQQDNFEGCRQNLAGTKFIISWVTPTTPTFVADLVDAEGPYTQPEAKFITSGEDWEIQNPYEAFG